MMELQHVDARVAQRIRVVTICLRDVFSLTYNISRTTNGFGLGTFSMLNTSTATAPLPRGTKCLFGLQRRGTNYHTIMSPPTVSMQAPSTTGLSWCKPDLWSLDLALSLDSHLEDRTVVCLNTTLPTRFKHYETR